MKRKSNNAYFYVNLLLKTNFNKNLIVINMYMD